MHEHLEEEEEQAAAKTRGFPAVGKRQGALAPAASSLHALEWVPSRGQRKARSTWYALHIPALSKAGAGGWLCASEEAVRKQYPVIAMATGWLRQEQVGPIRQELSGRRTRQRREHKGRSHSQLSGEGAILTASLEEQPPRMSSWPRGISVKVSQR